MQRLGRGAGDVPVGSGTSFEPGKGWTILQSADDHSPSDYPANLSRRVVPIVLGYVSTLGALALDCFGASRYAFSLVFLVS